MTVKTEFLRRITVPSVAKRGLERRNDCKNGVSEGDLQPPQLLKEAWSEEMAVKLEFLRRITAPQGD
ncbi:MAG: hypothetical protein J5476_07390 [Lachnospiraceae bacterium]|nr:hypothetical protein [Lachnospiraceae bacterium]